MYYLESEDNISIAGMSGDDHRDNDLEHGSASGNVFFRDLRRADLPELMELQRAPRDSYGCKELLGFQGTYKGHTTC